MKSLIQTSIIACAVAMPTMMPMAGFAQSAGGAPCACVAAPSGAAAGTLLSANGEVLVTRPAGFASGVAGGELEVGTRIVVGPNSSASIVVGASCRLDLPQNTDVSIVAAPNGQLCVAVSDPVAAAGGSAGRFGPPEQIFATFMVGFAIAVATDDGESPVSDQ